MSRLSCLNTPYFVYVISNDELGLYYIGIHEGTPTDDGYMGSSKYLDEVRKEFSEYTFTRSIIAQFGNEAAAMSFETEAIASHRATDPEGLLNRSPNNSLNTWTHLGYGKLFGDDRARLDKVRAIIRPPLAVDGELMSMVITIKANGKAHGPGMPDADKTPIWHYNNWSPEMKKVYQSCEPGSYHFAAVIKMRGTKTNYQPFALVEKFADETEARIRSNLYSKRMSRAEYADFVFSKV